LYCDDKKQCIGCPLFTGITIGESKTHQSTGVLGGKTFQIFHTGMIFKGKKAILETFKDITDRIQAESAIKISKSRFRTIFDDAPLGIALIGSLTGRIYEVNSMFAKIAGRTLAEMENIDWIRITHPDDIQSDLDNMTLLVEGKINGFQMEKRYISPDGSFVWINMTISRLIDEKELPLHHLTMIEDITERKHTEDLLRLNEQKIRTILDNLGEGVGLMNPEEQFEFANLAAEKIFNV
jgi:PAS domain S-box-containing protein